MVTVMPIVKARNAALRVLGRRIRVTSVGRAATDRGPRYGRQLVTHLGRQVEATWDEASDSGAITFGPGATVALTTTPDALIATLTCPASRTTELRDVIGRHLARFGTREGLEMIWQGDILGGTR